MGVDVDLKRLAEQEATLVLPRFDEAVAWQLGCTLRELALARGLAITIDIRRGDHALFFHAMAGTTPANADWARRKRNLVNLLGRSSYALGLQGQRDGMPIIQKMALSERDHASHGGCFPIRTPDAGMVGTITISGLPQRSDHALVVEVLAQHLGLDPRPLALD